MSDKQYDHTDIQEHLAQLNRALHETENLLAEITGLNPLRIPKPFWWDSNQAWGEVRCPSDWYRLVWYCNRGTPGETFQETQDSMLVAKGFLRPDGTLPSFGFRSEHIGAPLTLIEFLGPV